MPKGESSWIVEDLNEVVGSEFDDLPEDIQAKFLHLMAMIEEVGLTNLREPYVKHLQESCGRCALKQNQAWGAGCTAQ